MPEAPLKFTSEDSANQSTGVFRALRHRNFRLWFFGQFTSQVGSWMQNVAQGWLVLKLTDSSLMLGVVSFASLIPVLVVSLFAGVVVDRADRRRLLVGTQSAMMATAFALAALTWTGVVRVEHIIVLGFLNGVAMAFDMPGRQAFVIEMVGRREELPGAIALNSMLMNGARALGPALGGVLLALIGEAGCFFVNGLSFLAVIGSLIAMEIVPRPVPTQRAMIWRQLREGLAYAWHHAAIFNLLVMLAVVFGIAMQYMVLAPIFARDILHGQARLYGFLMGANGLGAVLGSALLSAYGRDVRRLRHLLIAGSFGMALAVIGFGLSTHIWLSLSALVCAGCAMINYTAASNTLLQLFVAEEFRGRVMSLYTLAMLGMTPLGSLFAGFLGQRIGAVWTVVWCGILTLLCAIYMLRKVKYLVLAPEPA